MADSDTDLDSDPNPAEVVADEVDSTEVDSLGQDGKEKIDQEVLQTIPVTITVQVGRASLKIRDLLKLTQGSVVELDRIAGEPLDLLVNNTVVAQGEIVLVNERYGIRLTRVIPATDRMKNI